MNGRSLRFGKRQNPDTGGREPDCQGSSWLLLQVPGSLKAPGPLKGGRAESRAALFQQQEKPTPRPSPVLPQQSSKAGPGPREGARTPAWWRGGSWGCMEGLWGGEEDTGESLKQGQEAAVLRWWALHESLLVG